MQRRRRKVRRKVVDASLTRRLWLTSFERLPDKKPSVHNRCDDAPRRQARASEWARASSSTSIGARNTWVVALLGLRGASTCGHLVPDGKSPRIAIFRLDSRQQPSAHTSKLLANPTKQLPTCSLLQRVQLHLITHIMYNSPWGIAVAFPALCETSVQRLFSTDRC